MAITKRPCSNCPFRNDGAEIELQPGRLKSIFAGLLADDHGTFLCHKTLDTAPMTCAGAVAILAKAGRLPVIARLGLAVGIISESDIAASESMVISPEQLQNQYPSSDA